MKTLTGIVLGLTLAGCASTGNDLPENPPIATELLVQPKKPEAKTEEKPTETSKTDYADFEIKLTYKVDNSTTLGAVKGLLQDVAAKGTTLDSLQQIEWVASIGGKDGLTEEKFSAYCEEKGVNPSYVKTSDVNFEHVEKGKIAKDQKASLDEMIKTADDVYKGIALVKAVRTVIKDGITADEMSLLKGEKPKEAAPIQKSLKIAYSIGDDFSAGMFYGVAAEQGTKSEIWSELLLAHEMDKLGDKDTAKNGVVNEVDRAMYCKANNIESVRHKKPAESKKEHKLEYEPGYKVAPNAEKAYDALVSGLKNDYQRMQLAVEIANKNWNSAVLSNENIAELEKALK